LFPEDIVDVIAKIRRHPLTYLLDLPLKGKSGHLKKREDLEQNSGLLYAGTPQNFFKYCMQILYALLQGAIACSYYMQIM